MTDPIVIAVKLTTPMHESIVNLLMLTTPSLESMTMWNLFVVEQ